MGFHILYSVWPLRLRYFLVLLLTGSVYLTLLLSKRLARLALAESSRDAHSSSSGIGVRGNPSLAEKAQSGTSPPNVGGESRA